MFLRNGRATPAIFVLHHAGDSVASISVMPTEVGTQTTINIRGVSGWLDPGLHRDDDRGRNRRGNFREQFAYVLRPRSFIIHDATPSRRPLSPRAPTSCTPRGIASTVSSGSEMHGSLR